MSRFYGSLCMIYGDILRGNWETVR